MHERFSFFLPILDLQLSDNTIACADYDPLMHKRPNQIIISNEGLLQQIDKPLERLAITAPNNAIIYVVITKFFSILPGIKRQPMNCPPLLFD